MPSDASVRSIGPLHFNESELEAFCQRWRIAELAVFGSVLSERFGDQSDVDVLVRWQPDTVWGLLDHARMEDELAQVLGRRVDLVSWQAVEATSNWVIRRSILRSAQPIYVA